MPYMVDDCTVEFLRDEIAQFRKRWPGCTLPDDTNIWFQFDSMGLCETNLNDHPSVTGYDGLALCEDAQKYLKDRTIPEWLTEDILYCHSCGKANHIHLIDAKDDGTGNYTILECQDCYGDGWSPT